MKQIFILLFIPLISFSQGINTAFIDSFMKAQAEVNKFNGSVLIAKGGIPVYHQVFGYRNYESKQTLDTNSIFELASVSKQFTAMGILLLAEKGKLKLTDDLQKYFPELPYKDITIHHLLTHSSGLPDYINIMARHWDHKKVAFNSDAIAMLAQQKLPVNFLPGEKFQYSNTGYMLLASIIEKVSGKSFKNYMDEVIFKPLGMHHSRVYNTRRSEKEVISNYAYGYTYSQKLQQYVLPDSIPELNLVYYLDGIQGDGIINSTASDLLKWDRALKNNVLISKIMQDKMFTKHIIADSASQSYYGYGVGLGKIDSYNLISHSGGWAGYSTIMTRYVDEDLTVIVLSNNESNSGVISDALAHITFGKPVLLPYAHKEVSIDSNILKRYTGFYLIPQKIELISKEGKLYLHRPGRIDIELKPESETKFFYPGNADRQIEFTLDKNGNVERVYYIVHGIKKEVSRL